MTQTTEEKQYELMVIIDPDIGENAINESKDKLRKHIKKLKGSVVNEDDWGLKNLAYRIKKRDRGHYAIFEFTLEPVHVREMDRFLRLEAEVLRHMLIALPWNFKPEDYSKIEEEERVAEKKIVEKRYSKPQQPVSKVAIEEVPKEESSKEETPKVTIKKEESKEDLKKLDDKLNRLLSNPDINL